jgi:hypothetical protein
MNIEAAERDKKSKTQAALSVTKKTSELFDLRCINGISEVISLFPEAKPIPFETRNPTSEMATTSNVATKKLGITIYIIFFLDLSEIKYERYPYNSRTDSINTATLSRI